MEMLLVAVDILIGLSVVAFFAIPGLVYHLNMKDAFHSWTDRRYQLLVFVHKRFAKVLNEGQVYERFVDEAKRIYNKDNFTREKSEFDNNTTLNNLTLLSEILEDESFVRKYFSGRQLTYKAYKEMVREWESRPMQIEQMDPSKPRPETLRTKMNLTFKEVLTPKAHSNTYDFVSKYVRVKQKAADLVHLFYALQISEYVNCDWKTFYHAMVNTFPEYITKEERSFRGAKTQRDNDRTSMGVREAKMIEDKILQQIAEGLNP